MMVAVLPAGSVAVLSYGERICGVFCIVGATVVHAMFPHVSDLVAKQDWDGLRRMVRGSSGLIVVGSIPIVLVFWFAAEPVVRLVFERGEFTAEDTSKVADVVMFAGLQVPGSILLTLAARIVMAMRKNRFVVISAVVGLGANVGLNIVFMDWFGVKGVALSTAMVNVLSAGMLFFYGWLKVREAGKNAE